MFFRKLIPFVIFLGGAVLGKPIALGIIGTAAKAYLLFANGWRLSYDSVDWQGGRVFFSDVDLAEAHTALHAKRIDIFFRERHLEIFQPKIHIMGVPWLKSGGDWTLSMKDGTVDGKLGEMRFSYEKTWPRHLGRLILERGGAWVELEGTEEENEIWVDAELRSFEADLLKDWIDLKGLVDGRIHLVFEGSECKRGSAHLDFKEAGYASAICEGEGSLDWEGEIEADLYSKFLGDGRLRLALSKGSVKGPKGGLSGLKGNLSFTAGVGAKWEFEGTGTSLQREFPLSLSGRAFLHDSRPHWAELNAECSLAKLKVLGIEEKEGFRWKGECSSIGPDVGTMIQSLCSLFDERLAQFDFKQGMIGASGEGAFLDQEKRQWFFAAKVEDLVLSSKNHSIQCESAEGEISSEENGVFAIRGASFRSRLSAKKTIAGEGWRGSGKFENKALAMSQFEGKIEGVKMEGTLAGSFEDFWLEAQGEGCEIGLKGNWSNGRLSVDLEKGLVDELSFSGMGWVDRQGSFSLHLDTFAGSFAPLYCFLGGKGDFEGEIESAGIGFHAEGNFESCDWLFQGRGKLGPGIGFYCPRLEKMGAGFAFDVRIETPTWDLARAYGTLEGGICRFDPERTHILGMPVQVNDCICDSEGLAALQLQTAISWKALIAASPIWLPETSHWISAPIEGEALVDFSFVRDGGSSFSFEGCDLSWKGDPLSLHMAAAFDEGIWRVSKLQANQWIFSGGIRKEGRALRILDGHCISPGIDAEFEGTTDATFLFDFHFPKIRLDLEKVNSLAALAGIPLEGLDGVLEGKGLISRQTKIEADFDFESLDLKAASLDWQNGGPIHLRFASDTGILCSGLDLHAKSGDLPIFSCKIDLLQFDISNSLWILNRSRVVLSPHFLDLFPARAEIFKNFDPGHEIDFIADLKCPSDFSYLSCFVKEASLPYVGALREVRDLSFLIEESEAKGGFQLLHRGRYVGIGAEVSFGPNLEGRFIFQDQNCPLEEDERPLSIDWVYSGGSNFRIREIEGRFGGIEASFHALDGQPSLIGSARVHFGQIAELIPDRIASVFRDLRMGKGYELKGKLSYDMGRLSFRGLASGKQIDLFGYQLRTLLGQIELDPDHLRVWDLKISDSAGMLKIDELIAGGDGDNPWTISIPRLSVFELRPSLLQKEDASAAPMAAGPLVVRELRIEDFKGMLEDSKTYTATGGLSFINSYRREHTVFDIPSDLLGRIVGLDLELLIPASGILRYELRDGAFHLTSLQDSFSEAKRSEFFLAEDFAPSMDLDGNLRLLVMMKQFVLFKFTESFQILIDGKLSDPQFHLQKKRRFLGL